MKKILFYSICAIALVACKKEVKNEQPIAGGAPASFNVFSPETKTTLDGLHVYWSAGDQIRVYGHNTSTGTYTDNGTYTLSSGAGTSAGVFTKDSGGSLTGDYDEYYAIYPGNLTATINGTTIGLPRLNVDPNHLRNQNPAAGQVDPGLAVMTAKSDGSKLVFRHGVGYIKVTIPEAGITQIDIAFQNNCLADTPTYNASTGAISSVGNASNHVGSKSGTFTQGSTYYFAAVPKSGAHIGTTTITFTGGATVSTSHFSGKDIEVGKVFDLGTPAVVPVITATDITGAAYAGVTTTHAISFANAVGWTPSILSYTGCVSAASLTSTAEIAATPSDNTINYTVSPYDALVGNTGTIVVRLSKAGEDPIDKTINVTQNTSAAPTPHVYALYRTASTTNAQVCIGEATCTYFSNIGGGAINWTSGGLTSPVSINFNPSTGAATATNYSYGFKFDSSGHFTITTHSSLTTTIEIYAAGKDATEANNTIVIDADSKTFPNGSLTCRQWTLKKGTEYTISRGNKELEVVLVVVRESI